MGWYQYYTLLEKYGGDITKATRAEQDWASKGNPDNPRDALALAEKKYREKTKKPEDTCTVIVRGCIDDGLWSEELAEMPIARAITYISSRLAKVEYALQKLSDAL